MNFLVGWGLGIDFSSEMLSILLILIKALLAESDC